MTNTQFSIPPDAYLVCVQINLLMTVLHDIADTHSSYATPNKVVHP